MTARAKKPSRTIFPNPNSEPVTGITDVTFNHALPFATLQTMRAMTSAERFLRLIRVFEHQSDDVL